MRFVRQSPIRFRLMVVCASYMLGLALGTGSGFGYWSWGMCFVLVCGALALLVSYYWLQLVVLTCMAVVIGYSWGSYSLANVRLREPVAYVGLAMVVSIKYTDDGQRRVVLALEDSPYRGQRVRSYSYEWPYAVGSLVEIAGTISPSKYTSDYGSNTIGNIKLEKQERIRGPTALYNLRNHLQLQVSSSLPEPHASLAIGLLTGVNDNFDAHFQEDLERTGTTHIVAVSGSNLTIVAGLLRRYGQRWHRLIGFLLAALSLFLYVLLAGPNHSILRGAAMGFLSLWAVYEGRITHRVPTILLGAIILSIISPLGMLYSISWQLSFLAFCGIIFIQPLVKTIVPTEQPLVTSLFETLSAEVMVLPIILYRFQTLSVISPLVNVAVLWMVPAAMGLSFVHSLIAAVSLGVGRLFAWLSYPLLWLIITPITWSSQLPFAAYELPSYSLAWFVTSYALVGVGFVLLSGYVKKRGASGPA